MLYLYQSNRLEDLAAMLEAVRQNKPLNSLLAAEEIIVQSQGMRRFLSRYLASKSGIAANLHFSLPASFSWQLTRTILPNIPTLNPFAPEVMRWRLLGLFSNQSFPSTPQFAQSRAALHAYLNRSSQAAYQLAGQLADIFDQYLIYRADWLNAWQTGKTLGLGNEELWQAELWRFLEDGSQAAPHRAAIWQQLVNNLNAEKLPERILIFGIATLAPLYLQLLQALAQHCDIHIFSLNPSSEYWGNILEPAQILRQGENNEPSQSGHPLLASLGKQGRDFFDALIEAGAQTEFSAYSNPTSNSLLHRLQHDIQTLNSPTPHPSPAKLDNSIRIISAHSPLRELQILKDHLLLILNQHPDWQAHDIAVLTPSIEPYSPFIEALFGQNNGNAQALPYSISDVKLNRRQPLLDALSQTLDLLNSRFETDKVLPLLENEAVLQRFNLTRQDLPLLNDIITRLNIHWGLDTNMRGQDDLFTWQQGLDRLVLGWMMPKNAELWQNISPYPSSLHLLGPLSRFAAFIRTLATIHQQWQKSAPVAEWVQRIRSLFSNLFQAQSEDQHAVQQIEQALAHWQEEADLADFRQALPMRTVIEHITHFLESRSEAGFLRKGITFCSMVPMRNLPFKVVCLLGLNDSDFPRDTRAPNFDLIARHPRKGDRARRDDDRYLFLEALMSAREILYLSYQGRSIKNNEPLAPSALLPELIDTLAKMCACTPEEMTAQITEHHPLQAFSTRYFLSDTHLTSSRNDYAEALNQKPQTGRPFFATPLNTALPKNRIQHSQLIQFWRNPIRAWLQHNLQWSEPHIQATSDSAEPFIPQYNNIIYKEYTDARRDGTDFARTAHRLQTESLLPAGELGKLWRNHFETNTKSLDTRLVTSPKLPPTAYTLQLDQYLLEGSLTGIYRDGLIDFQSQAPNAPRQIELMLNHLIFNAVRPKGAECFESHWLWPENPRTLPEIPQQEALEFLKPWLDYYQLGQSQPLPFFPKTHLAAAEEWLKAQHKENTDFTKAALAKAYSEYNGSKTSIGQREYTEVDLVFGSAKENPLDTPLFLNLLEQMLLPLYRTCQVEAKHD